MYRPIDASINGNKNAATSCRPGARDRGTALARIEGDAHFDILVQLAENADQPI
jgi:hypothetical protein